MSYSNSCVYRCCSCWNFGISLFPARFSVNREIWTWRKSSAHLLLGYGRRTEMCLSINCPFFFNAITWPTVKCGDIIIDQLGACWQSGSDFGQSDPSLHPAPSNAAACNEVLPRGACFCHLPLLLKPPPTPSHPSNLAIEQCSIQGVCFAFDTLLVFSPIAAPACATSLNLLIKGSNAY